MTPSDNERQRPDARVHKRADGELKIVAPAGLTFSEAEHRAGGAAVLAEPKRVDDALDRLEGEAWVIDVDTDVARPQTEFDVELPTARAGERFVAIALDELGNPYLTGLPTEATEDGARVSVRLGGSTEEQEEASTLISPGRVTKLWVKKVLNVGEERQLGLFEIEPAGAGFSYRKVDGPLAAGARTALVVHGALSELRAMEDVPRFLLSRDSPERYNRILGFEFETVASGIEANGRQLAKSLARAALPRDGSLDIFAYSMGTLVTRSCLELHGGSVLTSRVVLVAPPNGGTPLARDQDRLLKWGSLLLGSTAGALGTVLGLLFRAVRARNDGLDDLAPGSPFLDRLAHSPGPAVKYKSIPGVTEDSTFLRRVLGHTAGAYFGESNDWVVPLSSTSADTIDDAQQIASSHFGFFADKCAPIQPLLWGWLA